MTIISIPQAARRPAAIVAATIAAGLLAASTIAADATVSGPNRRPICNNTYFNMPDVGDSVTIPVTDLHVSLDGSAGAVPRPRSAGVG